MKLYLFVIILIFTITSCWDPYFGYKSFENPKKEEFVLSLPKDSLEIEIGSNGEFDLGNRLIFYVKMEIKNNSSDTILIKKIPLRIKSNHYNYYLIAFNDERSIISDSVNSNDDKIYILPKSRNEITYLYQTNNWPLEDSGIPKLPEDEKIIVQIPEIFKKDEINEMFKKEFVFIP